MLIPDQRTLIAINRLLPLRLLDGVEDDGQEQADGVSGGETHDGLGGNTGGLADRDHLVRVELKNLGHLGDQEGLASLTEGVGKGAESEKSALTVGDGLLVLEERRKALDDGDGLDKTLGLGEGSKGVGSGLTLLSVLGLDDSINKRGRHSVVGLWDYQGKRGEGGNVGWQMNGRVRVGGR